MRFTLLPKEQIHILAYYLSILNIDKYYVRRMKSSFPFCFYSKIY